MAQQYFFPRRVSEALWLQERHPRALMLTSGMDMIHVHETQENDFIVLQGVEDLTRLFVGSFFLELGSQILVDDFFSGNFPLLPSLLREILESYREELLGKPITLGTLLMDSKNYGAFLLAFKLLQARAEFRSFRGSRSKVFEAYSGLDFPVEEGEILSRILVPLAHNYWTQSMFFRKTLSVTEGGHEVFFFALLHADSSLLKDFVFILADSKGYFYSFFHHDFPSLINREFWSIALEGTALTSRFRHFLESQHLEGTRIDLFLQFWKRFLLEL